MNTEYLAFNIKGVEEKMQLSKKKNNVKKIGHVNLWTDSNNYNFIEMTHHTWLLSIVDMIAKAKF